MPNMSFISVHAVEYLQKITRTWARILLVLLAAAEGVTMLVRSNIVILALCMTESVTSNFVILTLCIYNEAVICSLRLLEGLRLRP